MRRIGLTGAIGIMGKTLQQCFPKEEWIPFNGEILNDAELDQWLSGKAAGIDALIHFAAIVPTHLVDENPAHAIRVNVEGTCRLLESVRKVYCNSDNRSGNKIPWIFLASSCHVYASSNTPLKEDSPLSPISLYGLTKLQAEEWARAYESKYHLPICIGRIFSSSSPLHPTTYFIPAMIKRIQEAPHDAKLEVHGLNGTRDFQTADHVCRAVHFLMEKGATDTFNLGSGSPIRLFDLVTLIKERLNRKDVEIIPLDKGTSHLNANVGKLRGLGFAVESDIGTVLDQVLHD